MKERWKELDIIKGIAVIAMILTHTSVWWYVYPTYRLTEAGAFVFTKLFILGGFTIIMLLIAAGAALRFSWDSAWNTHNNKLRADARFTLSKVFIRSFTLFIVATAVNVAAWGWNVALLWNVLQFMAIVYVCIFILVRYTSAYALYILGGVALLITFFYPVMDAAPASFLTDITIGDVGTPHIWPLFPWVIVPIFGFWIGDMVKKCGTSVFKKPVVLILALSAFVYACASLWSLPIVLTYTEMWTYAVHPPLAFLIATMSMFALLAWALTSINLSSHILFAPLLLIGRYVTLIYVIHIISGFRLIELFPDSRSLLTLFFILFAQIMLITTAIRLYQVFWEQKS